MAQPSRRMAVPAERLDTEAKRSEAELQGSGEPQKPLGNRAAMAGPTRLELATSCVTGRRSNQLNYDPA